jgi:hypothetical protein
MGRSILLVVILISAASGADSRAPFPTADRQTLEKTPEKHQTSSGPRENGFQSGQSCMANRKFEQAREHFTNYLKLHQVRTDSDLDLANLIGLGLACEALGDYRFAEGYFNVAAEVCLRRWYMNTPPQCCNFFSGQVYGFSRLEPFEGLMRLAVREHSLTDGFSWSEKIHTLKIAEKMTCPGTAGNSSKEKNTIRQSFASIFRQMKRALEVGDRKCFLELAHKLDRLRKEYPDYGLDLFRTPIKASDIPLEPHEALVEYQVTEPKTFAWLVQNRRIIKNIVIPLSRPDLETKIKEYLRTVTNGPPDSKTARYDPYLAQQLYSLLLKELLLSSPEVKKLIIIPDGALGDLPFGTLVNQGSEEEATVIARGNQPLRNSLTIEYYPSAKALQISRQKKTEPEHPIR